MTDTADITKIVDVPLLIQTILKAYSCSLYTGSTDKNDGERFWKEILKNYVL